MRIQSSNFTVAEILAMLERRELFVDKDYQRSPKVWPAQPRSFFIDTVLEEYPFPKVYFLERYDAARKQILRDIIDGQQRIMALRDFRNDGLRLSATSRHFGQCTFSEIPDEAQEIFLSTSVQVDLIKSATQQEILEMFRRMNAYTAPLNAAEKRHAEFQGSFKLFVLEILSEWAALLEEFRVFSQRQLIRMADAEFITELAVVLQQGIVNKSDANLRQLYATNDEEYPMVAPARARFGEFFQTLSGSFSPLRDTFIMKPYVLHSLFCAMMAKKYGLPNFDKLEIAVSGTFFDDLATTLENLALLAEAHETQDTDGPYADYVAACTSTTHRIAQRTVRTKFLAEALV